jgi:type II secretory pathway pseudopilin PulG
MRRGFEFSFSWLFSLITGALILILAVYGVTSWVGTKRTISDSETAHQLQSLLNPLQTSGEGSFRPAPIVFPQPTELTIGCSDKGSSVQTRALANIGRNTVPGYARESAGTVLFGNTTLTGTTLQSLVVPFSFPYKVSDLIVFWMGTLCFVQAPEEVQETFGNDNVSVRFVSGVSQCPRGSKTLCFDDSRGCHVTVDTYLKRVTQGSASVYYEGTLLYGAMLSSPALYECGVKQLFKRTDALATIYQTAAGHMGARSEGCGTGIATLLGTYQTLVKTSNSSRMLAQVQEQAFDLEKEEQASSCSLWRNA